MEKVQVSPYKQTVSVCPRAVVLYPQYMYLIQSKYSFTVCNNMIFISYYQLLGVAENAPLEEIKKAYKVQAKVSYSFSQIYDALPCE